MVKPTDMTRAPLLALSCLIAGLAWPQARVEMFSPSGYAKDVRQVTVRFTEAMVALGEPGRLDPFSVDCERRRPRSRWTSRQCRFSTDHAVGRTPRRRRCRIAPGLGADNRSPVALLLGVSGVAGTADSICDAGLKRHGRARRSATTLGAKGPCGPGASPRHGLPGRQWNAGQRKTASKRIELWPAAIDWTTRTPMGNERPRRNALSYGRRRST